MSFAQLSVVKHRIEVGAPLPFNVRNADRTLLLARGQRVESTDQLEALLERGALVDIAEIMAPAEKLHQLPRHELPQRWEACMQRVSQVLHHAPHHGFEAALQDVSTPVVALIERDPDLAIFNILRAQPNEMTGYGVQRSINTAVTAWLVAQRLGWDAASMEKVFKVALTSNISMLELQGQLARQRAPLSPGQYAVLREHPRKSCEMLEQSGVDDADWLQAVLKHHEMEDGSGYPTGCTDVGDLASLVRRADVYTGKLASRSHRDALAADVAGRQMFMEDPGHPMTAALVKEFGIYPPGCFVRLASGEQGIVIARGPTVTSPVVAVLRRANGVVMPQPVTRDTADPHHAVVALVGEAAVNVRITAEKLMALTLR